MQVAILVLLSVLCAGCLAAPGNSNTAIANFFPCSARNHRLTQKSFAEFTLTEAAKAGALCLDGTPGAYYLKPGSGDVCCKEIL